MKGITGDDTVGDTMTVAVTVTVTGKVVMSIVEWINKIHQGHSLELLKQMPNEFVDCVITSPPY